MILFMFQIKSLKFYTIIIMRFTKKTIRRNNSLYFESKKFVKDSRDKKFKLNSRFLVEARRTKTIEVDFEVFTEGDSLSLEHAKRYKMYEENKDREKAMKDEQDKQEEIRDILQNFKNWRKDIKRNMTLTDDEKTEAISMCNDRERNFKLLNDIFTE
jgi:hypothetical protein